MSKKNIEAYNFIEGETILLNKPYGWTSFGLVTQVKKWTKAKIGHSGTLDPLAEGLMICCTGKHTKKLTALIGCDKEYTGVITVGHTTPTYDLESTPENKKEHLHLSEKEIIDASKNFIGNISQLPPIHSAIKKGGKSAYELARAGIEVQLKPRQVAVHAFEITSINLPDIHFKIHCSSGTYIRSIANDLGDLLKVGAYLKRLVRTKIGSYSIEDAFCIEELESHFGNLMNARIIKPKIDVV